MRTPARPTRPCAPAPAAPAAPCRTSSLKRCCRDAAWRRRNQLVRNHLRMMYAVPPPPEVDEEQAEVHSKILYLLADRNWKVVPRRDPATATVSPSQMNDCYETRRGGSYISSQQAGLTACLVEDCCCICTDGLCRDNMSYVVPGPKLTPSFKAG